MEYDYLDFLGERKAVRQSTAQIMKDYRRIFLMKYRDGYSTFKEYLDDCYSKLRELKYANEEVFFCHPDEWVKRGFYLIEGSHMPCPPLPCGADDAWYENRAYDRLQGLAMIEAAAYSNTREAYENRPNAHAFDEWYFGDRVQ